MSKLSIIFLSLITFLFACQNREETPEPTPNEEEATAELYFPPKTGNTWETISPESLGWNTNQLTNLQNTLQTQGTRAFIVLKDGKIALEYYFGKTLLGEEDFDKDRVWYWASAGKTLSAFMVGKAQEEGFLDIQDKTKQYLGNGWTNLSSEQEDEITIWHQLTMTTGLNEGVDDRDCTLPECLEYLAEPGSRWAYHNGPYTLLSDVVAAATNQDYSSYFNNKLRDRIGMTGFWLENNYNQTYYSNARSMARFGLLMLNKGKWEDEVIMEDMDYYNAMINTSQNLNQTYGYLWWLNGKSSFMIPQSRFVFSGSMSPNVYADMYAAIGKNGQIINVIPSQNLVLVRMGDNDDDALVSVTIQNDIWDALNLVITE